MESAVSKQITRAVFPDNSHVIAWGSPPLVPSPHRTAPYLIFKRGCLPLLAPPSTARVLGRCTVQRVNPVHRHHSPIDLIDEMSVPALDSRLKSILDRIARVERGSYLAQRMDSIFHRISSLESGHVSCQGLEQGLGSWIITLKKDPYVMVVPVARE